MREHKLWHFQLAPALLGLLLAFVLIAVAYFLTRDLGARFDAAVELPWAWLDTTLDWIAGILTFVALAAVFLFLHKHIALVVLAPFLGRLAENIVRSTRGQPREPAMDTIASIRRSAVINTRSIFGELALTVPLLIIGFVIPAIGPVTFTISFLIQARYAGYGLVDFPLEYHGFDVRRSVEYTRENRAFATGIGTGYLILMGVPVIGWMLAPVFGTAAGTVATLEKLSLAKPVEKLPQGDEPHG
jgi:CysZ protein